MGWWARACSSAVAVAATAVLVGGMALNVWNIVIDARALGSPERACHVPPLRAFLVGSVVASALTLGSCCLALPLVHVVMAILGQVWYHQARASPACSAGAPLLLATTARSLAVLWATAALNLLLLTFFGLWPAILTTASSLAPRHTRSSNVDADNDSSPSLCCCCCC